MKEVNEERVAKQLKIEALNLERKLKLGGKKRLEDTALIGSYSKHLNRAFSSIRRVKTKRKEAKVKIRNARLSNVKRDVPVVKVIRRAKDQAGFKALFQYISREGTVPLINTDGMVHFGQARINQLAEEQCNLHKSLNDSFRKTVSSQDVVERNSLGGGSGKLSQAVASHLVFSFPHCELDDLEAIVSRTLQKFLPEFQAFYAGHLDTYPLTHVHIILSQYNRQTRKYEYAPDSDTLLMLRGAMHEELIKLGYHSRMDIKLEAAMKQIAEGTFKSSKQWRFEKRQTPKEAQSTKHTRPLLRTKLGYRLREVYPDLQKRNVRSYKLRGVGGRIHGMIRKSNSYAFDEALKDVYASPGDFLDYQTKKVRSVVRGRRAGKVTFREKDTIAYYLTQYKESPFNSSLKAEQVRINHGFLVGSEFHHRYNLLLNQTLNHYSKQAKARLKFLGALGVEPNLDEALILSRVSKLPGQPSLVELEGDIYSPELRFALHGLKVEPKSWKVNEAEVAEFNTFAEQATENGYSFADILKNLPKVDFQNHPRDCKEQLGFNASYNLYAAMHKHSLGKTVQEGGNPGVARLLAFAAARAMSKTSLLYDLDAWFGFKPTSEIEQELVLKSLVRTLASSDLAELEKYVSDLRNVMNHLVSDEDMSSYKYSLSLITDVVSSSKPHKQDIDQSHQQEERYGTTKTK